MRSMLLVDVMTFIEYITDDHRQAPRTTAERCLSLIVRDNAKGTRHTARCVSTMRTTVSCSCGPVCPDRMGTYCTIHSKLAGGLVVASGLCGTVPFVLAVFPYPAG